MKSGHQSPAEVINFFGGVKGLELAVRDEIIAPLFKHDQLRKRKYFKVLRLAPEIRGAGEGGRTFNYQRERAIRLWRAQISLTIPTTSPSLAYYTNGDKTIVLNKAQHPVLLKTAERVLRDWVPNLVVRQDYLDNKSPAIYTLSKLKKHYPNPTAKKRSLKKVVDELASYENSGLRLPRIENPYLSVVDRVDNATTSYRINVGTNEVGLAVRIGDEEVFMTVRGGRNLGRASQVLTLIRSIAGGRTTDMGHLRALLADFATMAWDSECNRGLVYTYVSGTTVTVNPHGSTEPVPDSISAMSIQNLTTEEDDDGDF